MSRTPFFVFDLDGTLITHYFYGSSPIRPFEFVKTLFSKEKLPVDRLAIASLNYRAKQFLERFEILDKFVWVECPEVQATENPPNCKPDMLHKIAEKLNIDKGDIIFYDDDPIHVQEAQAAGFLAYQVNVYKGVTQELLETGLQAWADRHKLSHQEFVFW